VYQVFGRIGLIPMATLWGYNGPWNPKGVGKFVMSVDEHPGDGSESVLVRFSLPRWAVEEAKVDEAALDAAAREALVIDLFRCGRLSRVTLGRMLGLDRFETSALLKRHELFEDPAHEEMDAEVGSTRPNSSPLAQGSPCLCRNKS
jgi:hypothetical protein